MAKNKIEFGNVNIPAEEFAPEKEKIRISIWIAGDVLDAYREEAERRGIGYQTLMQEHLRRTLPGKKSTYGRTLEETIAKVAQDMEKLNQQFAKLTERTTARQPKKRRA